MQNQLLFLIALPIALLFAPNQHVNVVGLHEVSPCQRRKASGVVEITLAPD
jgi:hypothetical protein